MNLGPFGVSAGVTVSAGVAAGCCVIPGAVNAHAHARVGGSARLGPLACTVVVSYRIV